MLANAQFPDGSSDKKANKAFAAAIGHYEAFALDLALMELEIALERDPTFAGAWMLKGQILDELGRKSAAADAFQRGFELQPQFFPQGRFRLCVLLHASGRYDEATQQLKQARALPNWEALRVQQDWERMEAHLDYARAALLAPVEVFKEPLPGEVNTGDPEYHPTMTADGQTLLFTRAIDGRKSMTGQEDFFRATRSADGSWIDVRPLLGINTRENEGAPTLQGDGNRLIFTACAAAGGSYGDRTGQGSCDLFEADWIPSEQRFAIGANLGLPNSSEWESQPSLSADGSTLLFVRSVRPRGDRPAEQDIFMSERMPDGTWSKAERLPAPINTTGKEENPILHPDGMTLYFASDGHPGMGGMDVFRSERLPDGGWGEPVNLGYPLNTFADEHSIFVTPDGQWALFATDREGSGNLDLWQLRLPKSLEAKEVRVLRGRVVDVVTGLPVAADVEVLLPSGQTLARLTTDASTGQFELPMPDTEALRFQIDHPQYAFFSQRVEWNEVDPGQRVQFELTRFEVGTVLTLRDVQFETGSAVLDEVFQPELEQLAALLLANVERVLIVGHTDNRGSEENNQKLSLERAASVRDYLLLRGVDNSRMDIEGRGADEPIASNESEEGRALNRRTEIVVIE